MNKRLRGNLLLLLTSFIWGTSFVAQKLGSDVVEPFTFNFARNVVAAVFLAILVPLIPKIVGRTAETVELSHDATIKGGIACGVVLTAAMAFQQMGIEHTTTGKAGFITALYIVLVPLIGVFLGKKIGPKLVIGVILSVIGLYLLTMKSASFTINKGDLLVLICALFYSLHILVIDHYSPKANGTKMSMIQFAVAALLSGIFMLILENPTAEGFKMAAKAFVYVGVFSSGIGYTLQIIAQKDTDPTVASLIMSLESVFAALSGLIFLGDVMTGREILGCIIMFAAIVFAQLPDRKAKKLNE